MGSGVKQSVSEIEAWLGVGCDSGIGNKIVKLKWLIAHVGMLVSGLPRLMVWWSYVTVYCNGTVWKALCGITLLYDASGKFACSS